MILWVTVREFADAIASTKRSGLSTKVEGVRFEGVDVITRVFELSRRDLLGTSASIASLWMLSQEWQHFAYQKHSTARPGAEWAYPATTCALGWRERCGADMAHAQSTAIFIACVLSPITTPHLQYPSAIPIVTLTYPQMWSAPTSSAWS